MDLNNASEKPDLNTPNSAVKNIYAPTEQLIHRGANIWIYVMTLNSWHNPASDSTIYDEDMPVELKTEFYVGSIRAIVNFMFPSRYTRKA